MAFAVCLFNPASAGATEVSLEGAGHGVAVVRIQDAPRDGARILLDGSLVGTIRKPDANVLLSLRNLRRGVHRVSVIGRVRSAALWLGVFRTPTARPAIRILQSPSSKLATRSARIVWRTLRAHAGTHCRLDRGRWLPCRSPLRFSALAPGVHVLAIRASGIGGRSLATVRWGAASVVAGGGGGGDGSGPGPGGPAVGTQPPPAGSTVVRFSRVSQGWGPTFPNLAQDARRYGYVIMPGAFSQQARALKEANPDVRVLVYKNGTQTIGRSSVLSDVMLSTGVDYFTTDRDNPGWFLETAAGTRITRHYTPSETNYLMDVGSAGYAERWARNVAVQVRRDGWDGVFIDDQLPTVRYWLPSENPSDVAKYPTDAAWMAATRLFLSRVAPSLAADGILSVANVCCHLTYGQRNDWAQFLTGTTDEGWLNPTASATGTLAYRTSPGAWNDWGGYLQEALDAEATGRDLIALLTGAAGDVERARYGLATQLLAAAGYTSYNYHASDTDATWFADFDTALGLGTPSGPHRELPGGIFRRDFGNGVVLVNPNPPGSAAVTIALDGLFTGSGRTDVTSVTLSPVRAAVLIRSGG